MQRCAACSITEPYTVSHQPHWFTAAQCVTVPKQAHPASTATQDVATGVPVSPMHVVCTATHQCGAGQVACCHCRPPDSIRLHDCQAGHHLVQHARWQRHITVLVITAHALAAVRLDRPQLVLGCRCFPALSFLPQQLSPLLRIPCHHPLQHS
jgi:hypothetical protein